MQNSKRIATNTILLYGRMLVLMVINLITVRVVLLALGVEDYGIYNAVAGVITMLNCISSVLSNATQRFYSIQLGQKNDEGLARVFSVSLDVYIILVAGVLFLAETAGLWFVNNKLIIPMERIVAANWAYQFSMLTFVVTILPMPYLSAILAHEKMGAYSLFTTCEYIVKLLFAILLSVLKGDVLIYYALFQFLAQTLLMVSYMSYGRRQFMECHYKPFRKDDMHKDILSFSGWTLFGSVAGIGMNQVMTILYNIFFGPIITGARAISLQLNAALTSFSNSFIVAIRPPMIKSYSESNDTYLMKLFNMGNKFIFYSLIMVTVPLLLEMDTVLKVWLKVTDVLTIRYSQLIIVYFLILALNTPISIIIQAVGKVKEYHLRVEIFTILCPILTYILFKSGCDSYYGYFAMILTISLSHIVRMICLKKYYKPFQYKDYIIKFLLPASGIGVVTYYVASIIHDLVSSPVHRIILVTLFSVLLVIILALYVGMTKEERKDIKLFVNGLVKNIKKKSHI